MHGCSVVLRNSEQRLLFDENVNGDKIIFPQFIYQYDVSALQTGIFS